MEKELVEILEILPMIGILFGGFAIATIWQHPRRWKVAGTVLGLIGLGLNAIVILN